ncbi:MAG: TonB-dependent receptor [Gammaproteobacteria bacterium]|nr:TonB-dependent receptor [Gammaproteobacteria bacterium]
MCPIDGHVGGNQMQRQSKWQATYGAEWRDELALGFAEEYFIRIDVAYQSKQYADAMNLAWVPERNIANASIGVIGRWYEARLWARNLFDELYVSGATVGVPNRQYNAYLGERRTFGLTFIANFDNFTD